MNLNSKGKIPIKVRDIIIFKVKISSIEFKLPICTPALTKIAVPINIPT